MLANIIAQANPGGRVAFDVVKLDDAVLTTVLSHPQPPFQERFKKYQPPADLKIAVGDTVSVVIWEAAANGLFGNSLTELSLPAGAVARLLLGQLAPTLGGVPTRPGGMTASPETLGLLAGAAKAPEATRREEILAAAEQSQSAAAARRPAGPTPATGGAAVRVTDKDKDAEAEAKVAESEAQRLDRLMQLAEQSGRAGTRIPDQQVGVDEAISVPYAGRIAVAGRTPSEVQQIIEARLGPLALEPQALVIVKRSIANSVAVAGEIVGGKRVELSSGGDRLLQVIAAAGGAKAPVHETFVRLSRDGVSATLSLATLVESPDQDIYAQPGDVVTLVRRRQSFSVFGATGRNATINFDSDRLSLAEALAKAGGLLDDRADPRAVFVFRYEAVELVRTLGQPIVTDAAPELSPIVYRLDLREAKSYLLARRFPVRDKDVIFVADAESRPIYRFFSALSQITGPVQTGLITCHYSGQC